MLDHKIQRALEGNERPGTLAEVQSEMIAAKLKGYTVPEIDLSNGVYSKNQAKKVLETLGVELGSVFCIVHTNYRHFPQGAGEALFEINSIIVESNDGFWETDYPELLKEHLMLSSSEGEGSYFYSIKSDEVFDVDWGDMDNFANGILSPRWKTFEKFLLWYYE